MYLYIFFIYNMATKRFSANDYQLVEATTLPNWEVEYTQAVSIINPVTGESATTASGAMLIGNSKNKWRYDAQSWWGINDECFELIQNGSNQVISTLGDTGGSRYLNISSGVTPNSETILLSRTSFTPPFNFTYWISLSQRINNCDVHIEMVEVDANWTVINDTSISTAPSFSNARSGFGILYTGALSSSMSFKVRSNGISEKIFAAASYGPANYVGTGISPDFFASRLIDISFNADRISTGARDVNQGASSMTGVHTSTDYLPPVESQYKIRIRLVNWATAPASSTDLRIHSIKILDHTRLAVDFGAIAGSSNVSDSAPVRLTQSIALSAAITGGQAAHSAASTGTPVRIGWRVSTTQDTTLVHSDTTDLVADQNSAFLVQPYQVPSLHWIYTAAAGGITNTTDVVVKTAAGITILNYITAFTLQNPSIIATEFVIKNGATIIKRYHCPANMPLTHVFLGTPIKTSANAAFNVACITTGAAVYFNCEGYTGL